MLVRAYEDGEAKVIRGAVYRATAILYKGPAIVASAEIDQKKWPFQKNNMSAWFKEAYGVLGAPMRHMITQQRHLEHSVNDGEGAKRGHGSGYNKFSYLLRVEGRIDERLDVVIESKAHAQVHKEKVAKGHVPKKFKTWEGLTYFDPKDRMVHQYQDATQEYLVWPAEEYYAEHPEWRGKLPAKGIDDPDDVRSGKWYPNG